MLSAFTSAELTRALNNAFDPDTIQKGETCFRQKRVAHLSILPADNGLAVSARVRGSNFTPYEVHVIVSREARKLMIASDCSCPVEIECKHGAAVVMAMIHEPPTLDNEEVEEALLPFFQNVKRSLPPPPVTLPADWSQWLKKLEAAATPEAPETNDYPPGELRRLLYILKPQPNTQTLQLEFASAQLLPSGGFSQIQMYYLNTILNQHSLTPFIRSIDVAIARKLALMQPNAYQLSLAGAFGAELLPEILSTGRCKWRGSGQKHPVLSLGTQRPATAGWHIDNKGAQSPTFEVVPPITEILPFSPPWYVDETTATCGPLETGLPPAAAAAWLSAPKLLPEQAAILEKELSRRAQQPPGPPSSAPGAEASPISLPAPHRVELEIVKNVKPSFCLRLYSIEARRHNNYHYYNYYSSKHEEARSRIHLAKLEFAYRGLRLPCDYSASSEHFSDGKLLRIERHSTAEQAADDELAILGLDFAEVVFDDYKFGKNKNDFTFGDDKLWIPFILETIPELRARGWQIEIDPSFEFRIAEAQDWYADAESSGIDWFGVELGAQVDGQKTNLLPLLLNELKKQPRLLEAETLARMSDKQFIPIHLPDGRILPFPASRVKEMLGVLLELFDANTLDRHGRLKLSKLRAAELSGLAGDANWRWHGSEDLKRLSDKLRDFKGVQTIAPSPNLKADLRPYQREGLNWLQFLREYDLAGILADDMGLGKTVQTLAHLLHEKESGRADRPSLVIAPTSLMTNWRQETERFAPGLKLLVLHGLERKQHFEKLKDHDLVVTSYPLLPKDETILLKEKFHYVVLDEAQYIKNPKTKYAQIACQLQARHHLCLTGTPMENHLGELWSQFNFLIPGFLGDETRFRKSFRNPIEKAANEDRRKLLARRVAPFVLRRRKEEVAKELPPKTEIVQNVELSGGQRDLYETIRLAMHAKVRAEVANKGMSRSHIIILEALLKLRQVCCDPRLVKLDSAKKVQESAKLELLMDLLPEMLAEGRRILLFSQFTSMLALIEEELAKEKIDYVKLTGETTDRATPIEAFQKCKVPLFLISLKAGGTGLNLTAADTVIHYDPWWNPAVENQATDRAHRIGQTKSVFVYKLMTIGTVEERILELQKRKRELVEGLLDENRKESLKLTAEDLDVLFAPLQ